MKRDQPTGDQADLCVHFNQRSSTLDREGFHVNGNQYVAALEGYITSQGSIYSCVLCHFDNGSIIFSIAGSASVNLLLTRFQGAG